MGSRKKALLIICSEGGHTVQMERLLGQLDLRNKNFTYDVVLLTDTKRLKIDFHVFFNQVYFVPQLRNKLSALNSILMLPIVFLHNLAIVFRIYCKWRVGAVLSTGAGVAILPIIMARLFGIKTVFIETWSKFEGLTFSGVICKKLVTRFYFQNKELSKFAKKGIYAGRL